MRRRLLLVWVIITLLGMSLVAQAQESTPEPPVDHPGRPIGEIIRNVLGFSWILVQGSGHLPAVTASQDPAIAYYAAIPHSRTADGAFVLGDPNAPVTIIAFEDFICPHCQRYKPTVDQFIATYVVTGEAKFEYRAFPVVDPTYSPYLPQLAECADNQQEGMFWPAYEVLYQMSTAREVGPSVANDLAGRLGLDANALIQCAPMASQVNTDRELAGRLHISGTPGVMVQYGDGDPTFITVNGQTYSSGGPPLEALGFAVQHIDGLSVGQPT